MNHLWNERLETAVHAARVAGAALLERPPFTVTHKQANDYVTEADRASEERIREILLSAWPQDGFLGEEEGERSGTDGRWIVDPIDGTTNFIFDLPLYTISIAYEAEGQLVLGCVYCPRLDEMYTAVVGQGAFLNGRPIQTRTAPCLREALVGMSFAHRNDIAGARMLRVIPLLRSGCSDMRRLGSAALDLCFVACGRYDAFVELDLHIYDIAAGMVILREAGGIVEGWPGDSEPIERTGNVFASSRAVHDSLADILRKSNG